MNETFKEFDINRFLDDLHAATANCHDRLDIVMNLEFDKATKPGTSHIGYVCPFCGTGGTGKHGTGLEPLKNDPGFFIHPGCSSSRRDIIDIEMAVNNGMTEPKLATSQEWIQSAHEAALKVGLDPVQYGLVLNDKNINNVINTVTKYRKKIPNSPTSKNKPVKDKLQSLLLNHQDVLDLIQNVIEDNLDGLFNLNNPLFKQERILDRRSIIKSNQNNFTSDCMGAQYLLERGISYDTAVRMGVGYTENPVDRVAPDYATGELRQWPIKKLQNEPCLFYPSHVIGGAYRSLNDSAQMKKVNFTGMMIPYNVIETMKNGYKGPIFIVEGFVDMLSIMEAGGYAIALNGTNSGLITAIIANFRKKGYWNNDFICLLDRDQAGSTHNQELYDNLLLIDGLKDKVFMPTDFYPTLEDLAESEVANVSEKYHDSQNEKFLENGQFSIEKFLANIDPNETWINFPERTKYIVSSWTEDPKKHLQKLKQKIITDQNANSGLEGLLTEVVSDHAPEPIPTGFKWLDSQDYLRGGFREGLYVLGAESSVGKTSLALQIADQIAVSGHDVLFFSLEMPKDELIAKSLSRYTAFFDAMSDNAFCGDVIEDGYSFKNALTIDQIMTQSLLSRINDKQLDYLCQAVKTYKDSIGNNLYLVESSRSLGIEEIKNYIERHIEYMGKKPVVFIDYLQIIPPVQANSFKSEKQVIDDNIVELKRLSRDFSLPIIAISSFNRGSYGGPLFDVDTLMGAFKESGIIEYTADIAMVLLKADKKNVKDALGGQKAREAAAQNNREVELKELNSGIRYVDLVILKNRNGVKGRHVHFAYVPSYHLFLQRRKYNSAQDDVNIDMKVGQYYQMEYPALTKDHQYAKDMTVDLDHLSHIKNALWQSFHNVN